MFDLSPNIDKNKIFLVNLSDIEGRLDPFYYIPSLSKLEKEARKHNPKPLRHYVNYIAGGATPKTSEKEKYYSDKEKGIPFLRVQNITQFGIDLSDVKFINQETHNNYLKRSKVYENDLLVTITGRIASAAVAPKNFEGNINQHSVVIKTGNLETSKIIAAYLNSTIGQRLALRRTTGGTRPALDYSALLSIPIIFDKKIFEITEKAVNEKRQKEAEAERLLNSIDDYLLGELGITLPEKDNSLENRMFKVNFSEVTGGRFDPKLYDNNTKNLKNAIRNSKFDKKPLKSLILHSKSGDWGIDEKDDPNEDYIKCLVIRATEFDNIFNLKLDNSRVKYRYIHKYKYAKLDIQVNDLLIEKSGGSPDQPVGRIAIITEDILRNHTVAFSNFIHKIRINEDIAYPEFLFYYLKTLHNIKLTDAMQSQTNGIRNLIMNDYYNLPVALPKMQIQKEISKNIKSIKEQAKQLKAEAKQVLEQAKQEVEKMILGE